MKVKLRHQKGIAKTQLLLKDINMREKIEKYAEELGFDLIGFTSGKLSKKYIKKYEKWLEEGYEGGM